MSVDTAPWACGVTRSLPFKPGDKKLGSTAPHGTARYGTLQFNTIQSNIKQQLARFATWLLTSLSASTLCHQQESLSAGAPCRYVRTSYAKASWCIPQTDRQTETDRQTDRQTGGRTDRQTDRQTQTHKHTNTQTHKHTNTQTHKHQQTHTHTHQHTHTHTNTHGCWVDTTTHIFWGRSCR